MGGVRKVVAARYSEAGRPYTMPGLTPRGCCSSPSLQLRRSMCRGLAERVHACALPTLPRNLLPSKSDCLAASSYSRSLRYNVVTWPRTWQTPKSILHRFAGSFARTALQRHRRRQQGMGVRPYQRQRLSSILLWNFLRTSLKYHQPSRLSVTNQYH